jgi:hypothetical protein
MSTKYFNSYDGIGIADVQNRLENKFKPVKYTVDLSSSITQQILGKLYELE